MDIDTEEEKIPKEKPSEIVCTFCMKPTCQDFANIQQKSDLLELLKKLNVDILPVNNQIDWICYQCTYKLNCIRDYARTWASCVTKNRINYYYRLGEKEMVRRLLNLKSSKPLRSVSIDGGINQNALINSSHNQNEYKLKISSVRTIGTNDIPNNINEQFKYYYDNESSTDNNNDYNRGTPEQELLSVMYEKSEPVLHTESGHIYYRHEKNSTPTLLTCKKCHRVYKKLSFLKKHERKHERDEILKSKLQIQSPKNKNNTIKCKDCERTFTSLITWRKHYRIHQSGLKCMYCPAEFILPADLEMHEAVCFGVLCAQNKGQQSHRYMTRSAHRTNYNDDNDNSSGFTTSDIDTMYTKRLNNARDWVSKTINNDNIDNINDNNETEEEQQLCDNEDDDDCQSLATTFTRASSHVNEQYSEEEEDDTDDLSTLTRPSAASKNTVYGLHKRIKETELLYGNSGKRPKICKRALDNYAKLINCPEKSCNFITTSLERLLEHDLTVHDEFPLFRCKKCDGRFLREIYLEDHLAQQNPGRYLCSKCGKLFRFEYDLKYHLIDHGIVNNKKKSKYCKICNLTFTNLADYYNHLDSYNHFQNNTYSTGEKIKKENIIYEIDQGGTGKKEEIDEKEQKRENIEIKQHQSELTEEKDEKEDTKAKFQDLFKDERKNLVYEQIMKDIKSNTLLNMPSKLENQNVRAVQNPTIEIKTEIIDNDYYNFPSFNKIKMETIKLNRVQPYKSDNKYRRYGKPFKRLEKVIFRRWKPHMEPLRMKGEDYYNCAIRPYKNIL